MNQHRERKRGSDQEMKQRRVESAGLREKIPVFRDLIRRKGALYGLADCPMPQMGLKSSAVFSDFFEKTFDILGNMLYIITK